MIFQLFCIMTALLVVAPWTSYSGAAQPNNPAAPINLQADKLSSTDSGTQIEATGNEKGQLLKRTNCE
jgi:lipopolysaccharide export system protein LptA